MQLYRMAFISKVFYRRRTPTPPGEAFCAALCETTTTITVTIANKTRRTKDSPDLDESRACFLPLTRIPVPPWALAVDDDVLSSILLPFFIADGMYVVRSEEPPASVGGAGPGSDWPAVAA